MASYDLGYEKTLTSGNLTAVATALGQLIAAVGPIRMRVDVTVDDAPVSAVFGFFENKVGSGSQVTLSITDEIE